MHAQTIERVCVFCGSRPGENPLFTTTARALGELLASRGIGVVYGGANIGVMGALAEGALAAGGEAIGVIPESLLRRELAHQALTELRVVGSMHERKAAMAELSDAFITMPGGIGTLEELFEVWTWAHLGIHAKPLGILNVDGFFDPLRQFIDALVADGFLVPESRELLITSQDAAELIGRLIEAAASAPPAPPGPMEP